MNKETVRWIIENDKNENILFDYNPYLDKLLVKRIKNTILSDSELIKYITEQLSSELFDYVATVELGYDLTFEMISNMEIENLEDYSKRLMMQISNLLKNDQDLADVDNLSTETIINISCLYKGVSYFHKYQTMVGFMDLVVEYKEGRARLINDSLELRLDRSVDEKLLGIVRQEGKYLLAGKALIKVEPQIYEEYWRDESYTDTVNTQEYKEIICRSKFSIQHIIVEKMDDLN